MKRSAALVRMMTLLLALLLVLSGCGGSKKTDTGSDHRQ